MPQLPLIIDLLEVTMVRTGPFLSLAIRNLNGHS
jgi:hypothetical protein